MKNKIETMTPMICFFLLAKRLCAVETLYDGLGPSYLALAWLVPGYIKKNCVLKRKM